MSSSLSSHLAPLAWHLLIYTGKQKNCVQLLFIAELSLVRLLFLTGCVEKLDSYFYVFYMLGNKSSVWFGVFFLDQSWPLGVMWPLFVPWTSLLVRFHPSSLYLMGRLGASNQAASHQTTSFGHMSAECCHRWLISALAVKETWFYPDRESLAAASEDSSGADKTWNYQCTPLTSDSYQIWFHSCQQRMWTHFHTFHSQCLSTKMQKKETFRPGFH